MGFFENLFGGKKEVLLHNHNEKIKSKIEDHFETVVNAFGNVNRSESRFKEFTPYQYQDKFTWCNYFLVPVDHEREIVLPKTYYKDIQEFSNYAAWFDYGSGIQRREYYNKLGSYIDLINFTNNYTGGASAVIVKTLQNPINTSSDKLINDNIEIEDLGYVVLCYFIDD